MPTDCIPFKNTNYFSELICDYLEENESLRPFYNRFPKIENFKDQIEDKQKNFSTATRKVLVNRLKHQYQKVDTSDITLENINLLEQPTTFTVTTGHQLNLFTGPLYFLYKIVSAINLAKTLKVEHPEYDFVPVYWMATEDHDFDEINYFNFKGRKVQWTREASGAVGELNTEGLEEVFEVFSSQLGMGTNADAMRELFTNAYLNHTNLADATLYLANTLFKSYGLIIVEANHRDLKQLFSETVKNELLNQTSFKAVSKTITKIDALESNYKVQVNPREINLFYLKEGLRERIIYENETYSVVDTDITWSTKAMMDEVNTHPERFSPNVIMRPLYQEIILPNLCYIGGGGELAYWLQLKTYFETVNVTFPMLLLRNSVVIKTEKQSDKLEKLNLSMSDLFLKQDKLINTQTELLSDIKLDFSSQKEFLKQQFENLFELAKQTDKSFLGAVAAQEKKQTKGLKNLEKRLLKAQKRKLSEQLNRIKTLQNELFPGCSLQERNTNFSEFYLAYGDQLIPQLVLNLQPLKGEFLILEL
ncbi:MAG: bacillithiol biosynthesis cysteine-adding enzyme BshC [Flavobacteriaceae bacterium]|nr:bacillithiol biosynthesis cysteine-adding enzyme BshC [Flavobacteriaceae bacterium]